LAIEVAAKNRVHIGSSSFFGEDKLRRLAQDS